MQNKEDVWIKEEKQIGFNTIYFYRHDQTPWGQNFMIARLKDPTWIPVFVDNYVVIFVKDNDINKEIINKYKLPDELFSVVKT
jgi:hypothetical protein